MRDSARRLTRKSNLHFLGAASTIAASGLASAEKNKPVQKAKAQTVINIFLQGGFAAQETFDPKLYAPVEYRGPYNSRKTSLTGIRFNELLVETSKIANKLTIIRSMTHGEAAHERGTHNMMTGYRPSPAIAYPSMGSIAYHELGAKNEIPPYICVPNANILFSGTGYLSSSFGPFSLGAKPSDKNFKVRDLERPKSLDKMKDLNRRKILAAVNESFHQESKTDGLQAMQSFYERAYQLMESKQAREAFNIHKENEKIKAMYGKNNIGMNLLMARRLAEAGARYITVPHGSWDHHQDINGNIKKHLPAFDKAYAALINDLDSRGLLEQTLVMITTEFGRTPKINKDGGRDHYPKVYSIVMAGGGVKRGLIYGRSNATSTEVEEDPIRVQEYAATVYHLMGIDFNKKIMSAGDRPIDIVRHGKIIPGILA